MKTYRYYDLILGAYVCVLLCANLIGAAKETTVHVPVIGSVTFLTGVLFFPISYLFGDILTEVYGYARDRRVVWSGFAALVFAAVMAFVIVHLPASDFYRSQQPAVEAIFGNTPRIVTASIIAFWCGSFVNSYVLAKMKIWTGGRMLWTRTIGSTIFGEGVDSALFYPLAFLGAEGWTTDLVITVALTQWGIKTLWEAVLTPVTYAIVGFLKRREGVDVFDTDTDFSPFRIAAGAGATGR